MKKKVTGSPSGKEAPPQGRANPLDLDAHRQAEASDEGTTSSEAKKQIRSNPKKQKKGRENNTSGGKENHPNRGKGLLGNVAWETKKILRA